MAFGIVIVLVLVCLPFYIIYNIYIRWGTGISWWESYYVCPKCSYKLKLNSHFDEKIKNEYWEYETKSGRPDLRYKENALCKDKIYFFKCSSCEHKFEIEDTEYDYDA
jgi:hypothetical protein